MGGLRLRPTPPARAKPDGEDAVVKVEAKPSMVKIEVKPAAGHP